MSKLVGIDLGTTFSAIGVLDDIGKPEIVPNEDGERITPSAVLFPEDEPGKALVGDVALKAQAYRPDRVIKNVKQQMGDEITIPIDGTSYTPQQISSFILKKLAQDASLVKGEIEKVVITVPANFRESSRKATMDAGELAGLEVTHIINEPTAAALYYASIADVSGRVLIYDLGGGTFDVTVADVRDKNVEVVASLGDQHLGGSDFDRKLVEMFHDRHEKERESPLYRSSDESLQFLADAEDLKRMLSKRERARTMLNGPNGPFKVELTRDEFEEMISAHIAKTTTLIDGVLDEAECTTADISQVLLVGGSSRIPYVQKTLTRIFGKEPTRAVNVDEAVALGATIYAGLRDPQALNAAQTSAISRMRLTDVCSNYYGTLSIDANHTTGRFETVNTIILKKNTPLPCSNKETFYTAGDDQTQIECTVTQSQFPETDPEFVNVLDKALFSGLPPGRPAGQPIEVTFSYDHNERMHCVFLDTESGKKHEATLCPKGAGDAEAQKRDVVDFIVE